MLPVAASAADQGLYLWHIESHAGSLADPGNAPLAVAIDVQDATVAAERLRAATNLEVVAADGKRLEFVVPAVGVLAGEPDDGDLADSFVIDYSEPAVAALIERFRAEEEIGDAAELIDTTTRFTDSTIAEKTSRHGFLIASQVAASEAGDCTEHAVLLAALARSLGLPARVVLGVLLVDDGDSVGAFGHAWTEIHDGSRWNIADATRPEALLDSGWFRHVPLAAFDNEGPGYAFAMLEFLHVQPTALRQVSLRDR